MIVDLLLFFSSSFHFFLFQKDEEEKNKLSFSNKGNTDFLFHWRIDRFAFVCMLMRKIQIRRKSL